MADLQERKREVFRVGSRVSVPKFFFDIEGSEFSALSPSDLNRLHGTISYVSKILRKISVTWDVDNSSSYCKFDAVQLQEDSFRDAVCSRSGC